MQIIGGLLGGVAGLVGSIFAGKKTPAPAPQALPQATRDDAAASQSSADALLRRRGAASDILTGTRGAEAATGSTGKLVITGN